MTNIQLPIQLCAFKSPTIGLETFTQCNTGKHRRRIVKLKECNRAKNEAIILVLRSVQKTTINAEILIYDGETKSAKLRKNVIYTKGDEQIKTNNLDIVSRLPPGNRRYPTFQVGMQIYEILH